MVKCLQPNYDANGPVPFATLMALEQVGSNTFSSMTAAFEPAGGLFDRPKHVPPRAFGGFVYAQAVWAAAHTMVASEQEWVVHVRDICCACFLPRREEDKKLGLLTSAPPCIQNDIVTRSDATSYRRA